SSSATNDWKHWVVMQGNDEVGVDDVKEVGNAIGVKLTGDKENMFSMLARTGKAKQAASGKAQGGGR
ncbi:hypothetical protein A2U01_0118451, partial [Trifolium medium]|nr:hypothetical protein [Trifolium medium]